MNGCKPEIEMGDCLLLAATANVTARSYLVWHPLPSLRIGTAGRKAYVLQSTATATAAIYVPGAKVCMIRATARTASSDSDSIYSTCTTGTKYSIHT